MREFFHFKLRLEYPDKGIHCFSSFMAYTPYLPNAHSLTTLLLCGYFKNSNEHEDENHYV